MKKYLLAGVAVIVVAAGGGAVWWKYGRTPDPLTAARIALQKGDVRTAAINLRNAVRDQPGNAVAHLQLGTLQLQSGDAVAAEKELKAAASLGSKVPDLNVMLAQSYLQQGRNKELLAEFLPPLSTPDLTSQLLVLRAFAQVAISDLGGAQASLAAAERAAPASPNPPLAAARVAVSRGDLAFAEQKINQSLRDDPKRPDALLLRGQILNAQGNRQGALQAFDDALALAPRYAVALLERANLLIILDQDTRAKPDVDAVLAVQPNSAAGLYLQAVLLTRAHDDAGADADFQKLSGVMLRFPRAFYFQAVVKYNLGQMEQATDSANRYVQRSPADPAGTKLLARILLSTNRADRALDILLAAVKSGTADAETLDLLGRAYVATGKPAQAVQSLDRAVAMAPDNKELLVHLASAKEGRIEPVGGGAEITRSLQLSPQGGNPAEAQVVAALAAGDVEAATTALATLRAAGNTETVGLLNGALLTMKQDLPGARTQYEDLIRANPAQVRARAALARVQMLQGQPEAAERTLGEALSREPTNEVALGTLLQLLVQQNRIGAAVAALEGALAAAPTNPGFLLTLSDLYVRVGTPDKAIALLDQGGKTFSQTPAALEARGRAQLALNLPQAARQSFQQVLTLAPGDSGVIRQVVALQSADKDWVGARATLNEALAGRPGDPELLRLLVGIDMFSSGMPAAQATIARLQADPVNRDGARTLQADLDFEQHRYREAAEAYEALLKAQPSTGMLLTASNAYLRAGMAEPATSLLRGWVATHADDVDAVRALSMRELAAGHLDAARPLLEQVLTLRPGDVVGLNNLAWVYQQQNDPRALALGRRAFLLQPSPQAADTLGWILTTQGDAAGAVPLLTDAAHALAGDPGVQFHYATALRDVGRRDEAAAVLRPIAAQAAPFDEQAAARKMLDELQMAK